MIEHRYRLKDYIITEYDNLFCTWEINIVLGEHRVGTCFIIGDILVIHSSGHKKNGCLKLEYCEKLTRLPVWAKTRYYCFSDSLKDVHTGKRLTNYLTQAKIQKEQYRIEKNTFDKKDECRLGRYKIMVQSDGSISWEKYDSLNKINSGSCVIKSGILFIGAKLKDSDETQSRKEWFRKLKAFPKWDRTFAWGHLGILHTCNPAQETKASESDILRNRTDSSNDQNKKRSTPEMPQPCSQGFKLALTFLGWVKNWLIILKPKTIEGLKAGSRLFFSGVKKIFFRVQAMVHYFRSR